jgi:outer membrane receptor protein involved in Fe transport
MPSKTLLATAALMALLSLQRVHAADEAPAKPEEAKPAAKEAEKPKDAKDVKDAEKATQVNTVIVTGTARSEGLRKLDASFSITTADEEQIKQAAPSSTADLLKIVPGVFVETTGGQSGANMRVRGFPTPGDGPYSTFQLNGSPLYALPTLSFFEHSQLFRLDDTIDRVEVLRGGPSPIFSAGQPGITVNFIQKQGGIEPEGSLRVTTGTGNLRRFDGVFSGPLSDKWRFMVGGFYRTDDGIRNTEFPADRGGQFSALLTRALDDGSVSLYGRVMNEKNAFYTAIPVVGSADGKSVSSFPGFDAGTAYFYGNELRNLSLEAGRQVGIDASGKPIIQREFVDRDLADGRGADVRTYGATLDKKFGAWSLSNKVNYTSGSVPTYALFSGANPQTLGAYISAQAGANGAAGGSAAYVNGGGAITDLTKQVIVNGMWAVDKELKSFTNETRLSRDLGANNTATVGLYLADYSSHDQWVLGQAQLMTVEPHARLVDVVLDNGMRVSRNGFVPPPFSFNLDGKYNGNTTALYVADEWKVSEALRLDGGIRFEHQRINGTIANVKNTDLDGDPTTLYDNNLAYFDGTTTPVSSNLSRTSVTLGANYSFSREFSMFGRVNNGHRMPDFDVLRGRVGSNEAKDPVEDITQFEIGLKTATPLYTAFLTAYHATLKNSQTQQFTNAGNVVQRPNSRTTGLEFEAAVRPLRGLELALTGNLQSAKYFDFPGFEGNTVERQPKLQYRFTPSYRIPTELGSVRLFATWTHVGERFASQANTLKLPKYDTLDAGLVASLNNGIDIRLTGTNLTNKIGLTEGNFRVPNATVGSDGVFLARPLFGRVWELSLGFAF